MKKILFFIVCILPWFVCCSNSEPPEDPNSDLIEISETPIDSIPEVEDSVPEVTIEGMLRLTGGKVTLGTNDKNFKESERPAMRVVLDYEFFMGIHEVTCGEYAAVAKKAKLKTFGKCKNDSIPITDISYYDAILYANAKSKLDGYDTAYTYKKASFDNEDHCSNLEGLATHFDTKAYRLPTEAEWVYAATRAWNAKKSWNSGNSNDKLHNACSIGADSAGFCDMTGNALEWVNDWMGKFRDTTITNYVGAADGGETGERVVKGGSFTHSEKEINPFSRGDVYMVNSATRAEYVGFRLAFGEIPNPRWLSKDGASIDYIITPLANVETIKSLTGSYATKLVFRNDISGNISYLNYLDGDLSVKEITSGIDAYHPTISPDGKWVAFCTGIEGVSGKSTLYVQSLEGDSTVQIKFNSGNAAIPRWRVLDNGDTVIVYVSDAGNNKDDATFKNTSTWQVKFSNGKFSKPQKLFDGAYHGGISEDDKLAVTGSQLLRARISGKEKVWYNKEQACNVSFATDGTKRTAFLDFGGKTGKAFVGTSYAIHQRILIADSNGKLIQTIEAPSGYTFDHSEWTLNGNQALIVATLTNVNGAHTKIVLVNPADSSVTELADGDELWHPYLWVKKGISPTPPAPIQAPVEEDTSKTDAEGPTDTTSKDSSKTTPPPNVILDPDSAGAYYNPSGDYVAIQWRYKMEMLWQYKDTANVVVLGSSRAMFGVNPLHFGKPFFALNLANSENTKYGSKYIFHNYVVPHFKKLKYVIISMDLDRWYHDDNYNFFYSKYKNYPGYIYDANHNFWVGNVPQDLFDVTYESLGQASYAEKQRPTRGFGYSRSKGWQQEEVPIKKDSMWYTNNSTIYYKNYNQLIDIIRDASEHDITVIGVEFPQSPAFKETGAYAQFGLQRSQMPQLFEEINDISKTYPNFIFVDENKMGNHDYPDNLAQDAGHLSTDGAKKMTIRLDSLLRTLE
jgi:Uncharacterized conserved protein